MERRNYIYTGRVQGVGFRATVRRLARDRDVTGWVRNEPDGTVRLEAQGEAQELDRLAAAVRSEMGRNIQSVSVEPAPLVEGESGFEIRR